ncbi:MAG: hypothetical protein PQ964_00730 [Methanobacteriaceae archaeon]
MTEKDLKNKKQEDIINYFLIGVFIIASLFLIYEILFIQPTKTGFGILLILILSAVTTYLVDIKQVTEKSEKKALWKIVIRGMGIIVSIIVLALLIWDALMH